MLARLEPEAEMTKLSPTKSEPIKSENVTNHIAAAPNAKEIAEEKKAKRVKGPWRLWKQETIESQCLVNYQRTARVFCGEQMVR